MIVLFDGCLGKAATRGMIESVDGLVAVDAIFSDLVVRVVAVPQTLEREQVLLGNVRHVRVIEVLGVTRWIRMNPALVLQSAPPVVVVACVDCPATLMIGRARVGSKANTAFTVHVPVVQKVLLRRRAPSRHQGNVIVLCLGCRFEC